MAVWKNCTKQMIMFRTLSKKNYSHLFLILTIVILTLYNLTPRIGGFDVPYYFLAGEHLWNGKLDCPPVMTNRVSTKTGQQ